MRFCPAMLSAVLLACGAPAVEKGNTEAVQPAAPKVAARPAAVEAIEAVVPGQLEEPVALAPGDVPPRRISGKSPRLDKLKSAGSFRVGVCILSAAISSTGQVVNVTWVRPADVVPEARDAIVAAVASWRFEPAVRNGSAIAVTYNFTVHHCPCVPSPRPAV